MDDSAEKASAVMKLRIWGARGSIPTPTPENLHFGGNTACVDVQVCTGEGFIFDCGTGIRNLGLELVRAGKKNQTLHVFLSHFHWDHLQGLPFFLPLYDRTNKVIFYSAHSVERLREVLSGQMSTPYFPINFEVLAAAMDFVQVGREPLEFGDVTINSFPVNHPQGASGYRICHGANTIIYATDHEHGKPEADRTLRDAARDADVLLYDAQFTPEEYDTHMGWGHSTWLEGTRVAKHSGVKKLLLFHHDPGHDDDTIRKIVTEAQGHFPETVAGHEGLIVDVG